MTKSLESACSQWQRVLGHEHVTVAKQPLVEAATATFPTSGQVLAILQPGNHAEVQQCLRIANQSEIALYPVSRGRNWGLGSRVPPLDAVVLDLSRLNQIEDYNPQLGYMSVEPGVTFQQASDFLRGQDSPFFLPMIGGSPHGSVIGNVAERGDGAGPYGQRVDFVTNIQAVLPTGDCVHSGFGRFPESSVKHLHRHGVGPSLDGLLTQSNLAVITKLTVWLTPHPPMLKQFIARITHRDQLAAAIDVARDLLLHRVLESNCIGFWNNHKISSTLGGYPWTAMNGRTPVDPQRFPSEPWLVGGAIYGGSLAIAEATGLLLEERFAPIVEDWQWCDTSNPDNVYLGVPTEQNVRSAYWRKKSGLPPELNPDGDRCGLIWMCFVVPLVGSELRGVFDTVEPLMLRHGFEPNIGFNCASGRCAHVFLSIIYDRDVDGEDSRATDCHDEVLQALQDQGHLPYRLSLLSMSALPPTAGETVNCLQAIKRTLDPQSILAPGRYDAG